MLHFEIRLQRDLERLGIRSYATNGLLYKNTRNFVNIATTCVENNVFRGKVVSDFPVTPCHGTLFSQMTVGRWNIRRILYSLVNELYLIFFCVIKGSYYDIKLHEKKKKKEEFLYTIGISWLFKIKI